MLKPFQIGSDNVAPWTAEEMWDAGLARFRVPMGPTVFWTREDWLRTADSHFAYAVSTFSLEVGHSGFHPIDNWRFPDRESAERHMASIDSPFTLEVSARAVLPRS